MGNLTVNRPLKEGQIQRLEDALRRNEKLALVGRITASVMHEINNPAEAITNLVYLLQQNATDPERVKSLSRQIEEQLMRIQYVARQTLSFFRETAQKQNTDLVPLIETAIRFHEPSLIHKKISVRRQMPETLMASVYPGDLLQLVSNLIGNAIDAIASEGTLCIRLRQSQNRIRLTIADSGCGIPQPQRLYIFEPFHTTKTDTGTGLGLWICKSVAEKHGGHLSWRSSTAQEKHGTTFSLSLAS
jgi:signal transduction histidine kinase